MKKIALFVVVLAAVAMVSCGGNANKSKECADHACTECCGEAVSYTHLTLPTMAVV